MALRKIDVYSFINHLRDCKVGWVLLALSAHLVNHVLRAYRWRLLLGPQGDGLSMSTMCLSEMTGFFVNTLGARAGEWMRCASLKKLGNVPIRRSLGTVFVERLVDLFTFFFFLLIIHLWIPKDIGAIVVRLWASVRESVSFSYSFIFMTVGSLLTMALVVWFLGKSIRTHIVVFCKEVIISMKSTRHANNTSFWLLTFLIMFFYFIVEYFTLFTLQATTDLPFSSAVLVFFALNVSHLVPLPGGGTGLFHTLVVWILCDGFELSSSSAMAYATIVHGIQLFNGLVIGGLCSLGVVFSKGPNMDLQEE